MDLDAMITTLRDSKKPLGELTLPSASGVYAVFLRDPECIPELHSDADFPVYVGRSSDLDRRALRQHLRPNASGSSTLRRSLGAILKGELGLRAVPRGSGHSDRDCANYCFEGEGESKLTGWMNLQLDVAFYPVCNPKPVEEALVVALNPPLNLVRCRNPYAGTLRTLRKACANEARAARE